MKELLTALHAAIAEAPDVGKGDTNDFHHYKYASEVDIVRKLRVPLQNQGLIFLPTMCTTEWASSGRSCMLMTTWTLYHVESGGMLSIKVPAMGEDKGDKAPYKAMAGARKYAYLRLLARVAGDDDPEGGDQAPPVDPKVQKVTDQLIALWGARIAELGLNLTPNQDAAAGNHILGPLNVSYDELVDAGKRLKAFTDAELLKLVQDAPNLPGR